MNVDFVPETSRSKAVVQEILHKYENGFSYNNLTPSIPSIERFENAKQISPWIVFFKADRQAT